MSVSTAWKLTNSLPLSDIGNQSRFNQHGSIRDIVESPQKVVTPSVHPSPNQYLTNVESEALVQLIDTRAHNKQAMGMTSIRQYAADMKALRLHENRVTLHSRSWYYAFTRQWLQNFRELRPASREYKRANAERARDIEAFCCALKKLYEERLPSTLYMGSG